MAAYLRRYTDLPSLVYLLTERKLTLLDPQSWDDRNDSYYLGLYRDKKKLKTVLALCFSQADETYHHWRVFASGSSGVCIRFRRQELLRKLRRKPGIKTRTVRYLTLEEIRNTTVALNELPFLKRYAFQHENEFRVIFESSTQDLPKLDIAISLAAIHRITLSPWIHPELSPHIKKMLRAIRGCGGIDIVRSTLIGNTEWKNLGDHAA